LHSPKSSHFFFQIDEVSCFVSANMLFKPTIKNIVTAKVEIFFNGFYLGVFIYK
jgi:hypothetical protein